MTARPPLPGWPRGMPEWMAAGYVGLSETMLRQQDIKRTWLTDGRMVYLREHLDAWLDAKDGRAPVVTAADFDWRAAMKNVHARDKKPLTSPR